MNRLAAVLRTKGTINTDLMPINSLEFEGFEFIRLLKKLHLISIQLGIMQYNIVIINLNITIKNIEDFLRLYQYFFIVFFDFEMIKEFYEKKLSVSTRFLVIFH